MEENIEFVNKKQSIWHYGGVMCCFKHFKYTFLSSSHGVLSIGDTIFGKFIEGVALLSSTDHQIGVISLKNPTHRIKYFLFEMSRAENMANVLCMTGRSEIIR